MARRRRHDDEDDEDDDIEEYEPPRRRRGTGWMFPLVIILILVGSVIGLGQWSEWNIATLRLKFEGTASGALAVASGQRKVAIRPGENISIHSSSMISDINFGAIVQKYNSQIGWNNGHRNTAITILTNWISSEKITSRTSLQTRSNAQLYAIMTAPTTEEAKQLVMQ